MKISSPPENLNTGFHPSPFPRTVTRLGSSYFVWILYLQGFAAAEWVTAFIDPRLGLVIHGSMLVLIFTHAALWAQGPTRKFLLTIALAPLLRLLSLSMPLAEVSHKYWYAIIGLPLSLATVLVLRLTGFKTLEIGLSWRNPSLQAFLGLMGIGLGRLEFHILKPDPLVGSWSLKEVWLTALMLLIFAGFLEEFIFRGLMQCAAKEVLGKYGLLYVALLYAVLQLGNRSFLHFAMVLVVGLAFGWIVQRTRSIWGVVLAHGLTNIALYMIFPLW